MYNRYVPQSDGSFRRSSISEPPSPPRSDPPHKEKPAPPPPQPPATVSQKPVHHQSIGSFIKQLLPKGFDTADLLIVLLLILMAGDCEEDQNTALLTLVLYLFL